MFSPYLLLLSLALASNGAVLGERGATVDCGAVSVAIAGATNGASTATAFCRQQLALVPRYTTFTSTKTKTKTQTLPVTIVSTKTLNMGTSTQTKTALVTKSVTVTPATSTVTQTITSIAYVDGEGNTLMKRDGIASPTEGLEKRALPTPPFLKQFGGRAQVLAACQCLDLKPQTYTRTAFTTATSTVQITQTHNALTTSIIPLVVKQATVQSTIPITVQAPIPISIVTETYIQNEFGCPPTELSTFICPDGTGADDGSLLDTNQLDCAVQAVDGFYGECVYWLDDGSPFGSMLNYEDDEGGVYMRPATYGDEDTDDCASWANFTCQPAGALAGRSLDDMSPVNAASSLLARATRSHKKKKIPKGLRRGGRYVPYAQVVTSS